MPGCLFISPNPRRLWIGGHLNTPSQANNGLVNYQPPAVKGGTSSPLNGGKERKRDTVLRQLRLETKKLLLNNLNLSLERVGFRENELEGREGGGRSLTSLPFPFQDEKPLHLPLTYFVV
jgi:hypothetical protein